MSTLHLAAIYIYPIKSLAGIAVEQWPVNAKGLLYDRHWMLIDADNKFLSQRRLPRMALVHTALTATELLVNAPTMPELRIPLAEQSGEGVYAEIWDDHCLSQVVASEADEWFSLFLGQRCRLVYQPEHSVRAVDAKYAQAQDQTSFSDGYPFLLLAENSLAALNAQLAETLDMRRFRPNLVVAGCAAYAEDTWRELSIGSMHFRLPKPCSRCSVPNVDPETAVVGKEPLQTLSKYRQWQNKVYFGQNALHDSCGTLARLQEVKVLSMGPAQPPLDGA